MSAVNEIRDACDLVDYETDSFALIPMYLLLGIAGGLLAIALNNATILLLRGEEVPIVRLFLFDSTVYPQVTESPFWIGPVNESIIVLMMFVVGIVLFAGITKAFDDRLPCLDLQDEWVTYAVALGLGVGAMEVWVYRDPLLWARFLSLVAHPLFALIVASGILHAVDDFRICGCEWDQIAFRLVLAIIVHAAANEVVVPQLLEWVPWLTTKVVL